MNPDLCLKPIPWATQFPCQREKGHETQCSHYHREAAKPEYVRLLEDVIREAVYYGQSEMAFHPGKLTERQQETVRSVMRSYDPGPNWGGKR